MSELGTADLDLQILRAGERYEARVRSPAGEAAHIFSAPFSDEKLQEFWTRAGGLRRVTRRVDDPDLTIVKDVGSALFEAVFAEGVRECLRGSLDAPQHSTLRIRLRLSEVPELSDLPWEYLYDRERNRFIGLSIESPIVRYLDLREPAPALMVAAPLNVLVVSSSPRGEKPLNLSGELHQLQQALGQLIRAGLVVVDCLGGPPEESVGPATLDALRKQLRGSRQYHVLHFIGHGGFDVKIDDGYLVLEDDRGRGDSIGGQALGVLLRDHKSMRLAMLNACEGARSSRTDPFAGVAQALVQQGMAAVVAMQAEITDRAAILFAQEFYGSLADGRSIEASVVRARQTLYTEALYVEWGIPVLYSRAAGDRSFRFELRTESGWLPGAMPGRFSTGSRAFLLASGRALRIWTPLRVLLWLPSAIVLFLAAQLLWAVVEVRYPNWSAAYRASLDWYLPGRALVLWSPYIGLQLAPSLIGVVPLAWAYLLCVVDQTEGQFQAFTIPIVALLGGFLLSAAMLVRPELRLLGGVVLAIQMLSGIYLAGAFRIAVRRSRSTKSQKGINLSKQPERAASVYKNNQSQRILAAWFKVALIAYAVASAFGLIDSIGQTAYVTVTTGQRPNLSLWAGLAQMVVVIVLIPLARNIPTTFAGGGHQLRVWPSAVAFGIAALAALSLLACADAISHAISWEFRVPGSAPWYWTEGQDPRHVRFHKSFADLAVPAFLWIILALFSCVTSAAALKWSSKDPFENLQDTGTH